MTNCASVERAVLAVTSRRSVREVLQTIVASARRLLDARYAALGVPDDDGGFAEFLADGISDEQWAAIGPLPRQHGLLGVMLRDPNPVRLADIRAHPRLRLVAGGASGAAPTSSGCRSWTATRSSASCSWPTRPTAASPQADEELLQLLAAHAAIALVNARLYERSRELSIMEERHRIARELHDSVTQKLFSLRLTADAAATLLTTDDEAAAHAGHRPAAGRARRPTSCGPSWSDCARPTSPATAWPPRCASRPSCSTGPTAPR